MGLGTVGIPPVEEEKGDKGVTTSFSTLHLYIPTSKENSRFQVRGVTFPSEPK